MVVNQQNGGLKVLVQNRPNVFAQRGGDTVVMEALVQGLRKRGVQVTVDVDGAQDPAKFDIVHLFNFATPDITQAQAKRAHAAGIPYVVTTLYEDVPSFHNQSRAVAASVVDYVRQGQDRVQFEAHRKSWVGVGPSGRFDNEWTARHASALLSSGAGETKALTRDYPGISNVVEAKFGYDVGAVASPEAFVREFGVKDFVLCVGRLESRKNQLMLLKALEDSELTVVLAAGGFCYQPEYAHAVQSFKRKGKTIVLGRLEPAMLASMYAAAKVHALPSWYELPGLVSLEAAYYGCNVVATDRGTTKDYLGDLAFYCEPENESTILAAVMAAFYSPLRTELKESVMKNTWDEATNKVFETYKAIAQSGMNTETTAPPEIIKDVTLRSEGMSNEIEALLTEGEEAARKRDYPAADDLFDKVLSKDSRTVRAIRGKGAIRLAQSDFSSARALFERAFLIEPDDAKTLSGLGMCDMMAQRPTDAYPRFVRALELDGEHLVTILQLVECSYRIGRFDDLVRVLEKYSTKHPEDLEMAYCYAGALFKIGREEDSERKIDAIMAINSEHLGAKQLKSFIAERREIAQKTASVAAAAAAKAQPATANSANTELDIIISELEDKKRTMDFAGARVGAEGLLARSDLSASQKERATLLRAEVYVLEGDRETAQTLFSNILSANPKCARAICGRGAIEASQGKWAEAEVEFRQALTAEPGYDVALAGLALCSSWKKNYDEAWDYYTRALKKNPENVRALLGVIELGYPLNKLDDVEGYLRTYLDTHPADLEFIYALAGCCFAQNKCREALNEVERITLFAPEHQRANELKQMIQDKQKVSVAARV